MILQEVRLRERIIGQIALIMCLLAPSTVIGETSESSTALSVLAYAEPFQHPIPPPKQHASIESIVYDQDKIDPVDIDFTEEKILWLLDIRNDWSEKISATGGELDAFFAGKQSQIHSNASFLRLRIGPTFAKSGSWDTSPDIKFKLNLPLTKSKYRFVLESDPDDGKSLADKAAENIIGGANTERENATGAFRLISDLADGWVLTNDLGVKIRWPPDPFVRTKAAKEWQLADGWSTEVLASAYWYQSDGVGANIVNNFDKQLTSALFFRNTAEIRWTEEEDKFEFSETVNLYHTWDQKRVVRYRAGLLSESKPKSRPVEYYLEATYRQKLYRNWLFYEIIPALTFPDDDNYKTNPSITVKLEILFSKK
ncbi:MAG: hypothetical protein H7A01_09685 [Hahellaceae bacterium]|nr:hypothetical protein [Hahellaceae bacterium]MCP5211253.1 hypothetical protein [Hahellaceae bacterium]